MVKLCVTLFLSVVVGRWLYAETELIAPAVVPVIDYVLERTQIPTHDQWSKDSFQGVLREAATLADSAVAALHTEADGAQASKPAKKRYAARVDTAVARGYDQY